MAHDLPCDGRPPTTAPRLGVLVPCRNEALLLPRFLHSLRRCLAKVDPERVEVVIADNASTDGTGALLARHRRQFPDVLTCQVPTPGAGHARAAAAAVLLARSAVRGEQRPLWLVSVDADCELPVSFLSEWLAAVGSASAPVLSGRCRLPDAQLRRVPVARRVLGVLGDRIAELEATFGIINPSGANHAVAAEFYMQVGPYRQPSRRGPGGAQELLAGEDWDLGTRTRALGRRIERVPVCVTTSGRRALFSPDDFVTGTAYEGCLAAVRVLRSSSRGPPSEGRQRRPSQSHPPSRQAFRPQALAR